MRWKALLMSLKTIGDVLDGLRGRQFDAVVDDHENLLAVGCDADQLVQKSRHNVPYDLNRCAAERTITRLHPRRLSAIVTRSPPPGTGFRSSDGGACAVAFRPAAGRAPPGPPDDPPPPPAEAPPPPPAPADAPAGPTDMPNPSDACACSRSVIVFGRRNTTACPVFGSIDAFGTSPA